MATADVCLSPVQPWWGGRWRTCLEAGLRRRCLALASVETAFRLWKQRPGQGPSRDGSTVHGCEASDQSPNLSEPLPPSVREWSKRDSVQGAFPARLEELPGCAVLAQMRERARTGLWGALCPCGPGLPGRVILGKGAE